MMPIRPIANDTFVSLLLNASPNANGTAFVAIPIIKNTIANIANIGKIPDNNESKKAIIEIIRPKMDKTSIIIGTILFICKQYSIKNYI